MNYPQTPPTPLGCPHATYIGRSPSGVEYWEYNGDPAAQERMRQNLIRLSWRVASKPNNERRSAVRKSDLQTVVFRDGSSARFEVHLYAGACLAGDPTAYIYLNGQLVWVKPGEFGREWLEA